LGGFHDGPALLEEGKATIRGVGLDVTCT